MPILRFGKGLSISIGRMARKICDTCHMSRKKQPEKLECELSGTIF